ncbi:GrBNV gp44-like protein-like protein [Mauternbach virus]|uniref:GrBNV gp44-like protein-like protein n=1 Tax=Mauternbach virus TaxID=2486603 RepID=A0A3G3E637_9VIRU|nr:GrBNV gp44-like protein-like protein [Mauternbach virus]AYP97936.1 GrBNV gp44-like protein-like protein [Mauternbach virus]
MGLTEQEIFEICMKRVQYKKLNAPNHTLAIDGTSCTMKTSILNKTGYPITKVQRNHRIQNPDTFGPSMIGYVCAGINDSFGTVPHFSDRSPMNVIDWHILWKFMDRYLTRFGNVAPNEKNAEMTLQFNMFRTGFRAYREKCEIKNLVANINCIAIVDTNILRCDEMRLIRNRANSDIERSTWKFYTFMQNLMYMELYPDLYIDMAWFHNSEADKIVYGVSKFFNTVLNHLIKTIKPSTCNLYKYSLPTIRHDYNLSNITVHAYRSIGRWGCRTLIGNDEELRLRMPVYLEVDNIRQPNGLKHDPIIPTTRKYIFSTTTNDSNNYYHMDDCNVTYDFMTNDTLDEMFN